MQQAQVLFDEFGQPFIVVRDQEKQKRLTGIDALKVCNNSVQINSFKLVIFEIIYGL